jgi:hypothetical protein
VVLMGTWSRPARADTLQAVAGHQEAGCSERQAAQLAGVARSTVRHWRRCQEAGDLSPQALAFFATPSGEVLLEKLVVAAHLVITLRAGAGVRLVCQFLQLSGLSSLVGASYGAQQAVNVQLEAEVAAFGQREGERLGRAMPHRRISLCEDETYHPEVCLVGIEPVSNFIVLEQYAQGRSAADWDQALDSALSGLSVTVEQVASDQAGGVCQHITGSLGAHQSPDLFHIQQEISRATAAPLARRIRQAEQGVERAQAAVQAVQAAQLAHDQGPSRRGRRPDFDGRRRQAQWHLAGEQLARDRAQDDQQQARAIREALSHAYHPYDLDTGQRQSPKQFRQRLLDCWARLNTLAGRAQLSERCQGRLDKAQRLTEALTATIAFYFAMITARVEAMNLPPEVESALHERLIPAVYLEQVAERSGDPQQRQRLREQAQHLLDPLRQDDGPLAGLDQGERQRLEHLAVDCAQCFQRSSSCVEGRNGQLALYHHGRHRLSERRLAALTTVHNFLIRRPDGTTAAERFFGQSPADLFETVCARIKLPGRPARKRPRPGKPPRLYVVETQGAD